MLATTNVCAVGAFEAQFNKANRFPCSVDTVVRSGEFLIYGEKNFKHIKVAVWEQNGRKDYDS